MFDLAVREEDWATADSLTRRKFPQRLPYVVRVLFAAVRRDTASLRLLREEGRETAGQRGRVSDRALEAGWLLASWLEELERPSSFF